MGSIKWLSHSGFEIVHDKEIILIDPYLTGNPLAPLRASEISKADMVCVTHDHHDHLGDAIDICKRTGATFVGIAELSQWAQSEGVKDVVRMNIGGTVKVKGIDISMVHALHSSIRGSPVGFIINLGKSRIYHAGDTALFSDMRTVGEFYKPEIACLPIGGHYTMAAQEAAEAAWLLNPKVVIPMHYMGSPVLAKSADEFVSVMRKKNPGIQVLVLKPGEKHDF
ncbi:MAG: metal-dependent hydrolase [Methanobacteriota archaeon]